MKIIVNHKVRALLVELDAACQRFDEATAICCDRDASHENAVNAGAEKELLRGVIHGIAHQIRMYSTRRWKS